MAIFITGGDLQLSTDLTNFFNATTANTPRNRLNEFLNGRDGHIFRFGGMFPVGDYHEAVVSFMDIKRSYALAGDLVMNSVPEEEQITTLQALRPILISSRMTGTPLTWETVTNV